MTESDKLPTIVEHAARKAAEEYLQMCRLDSPWEVPESFLATQTARALALENGLRTALEFRMDNASNAPTREDRNEAPARLHNANAFIDVAIFRSEPEPWQLTLDGIIEFKKQASMVNDARFIEFMIDRKHVSHGLLVLFAVGRSAVLVEDSIGRWTGELISSGRWLRTSKAYAQESKAVPGSRIKDRWWDICCLKCLEANSKNAP